MNTEKETDLDWQLRRLRMATAAGRSSPAARQAMMDRFAAQHPATVKRGVWAWPLTIAAALVLSLAVVRMPREAATVAPAEDIAEVNDGFIAVPFVPPLAQGELVHVVHTELHPAALAGLGVNVDPAWVTAMPADLLVGDDGFPRAVRVSNEDSGGF